MAITRAALYTLTLGLASTAHAEYSWELAGRFERAEQDRARSARTSEFDSDLVSLSATHYFRPVSEGSGPLALAAFFDPSTQLSVAAGEEDTTNRFFAGPNSLRVTQGKEEVSDYSLRGLYLFPESKWYAGGRYARHEGEGRSSSIALTGTGSGMTKTDFEDYGLFAGRYFGTGATRLELALEQSTTQREGSSTSCSFSGACFTNNFSDPESILDMPRLGVMHVGRFRSATYALLGEYGETRLHSSDFMFEGVTYDPDPAYFVGAELYPVPRIGVRLAYESFDDLGFDEDTVSIGASFFFGPNVGLELTLSREDTDTDPFSEDSPNTHRAALRVIGRL